MQIFQEVVGSIIYTYYPIANVPLTWVFEHFDPIVRLVEIDKTLPTNDAILVCWLNAEYPEFKIWLDNSGMAYKYWSEDYDVDLNGPFIKGGIKVIADSEGEEFLRLQWATNFSQTT